MAQFPSFLAHLSQELSHWAKTLLQIRWNISHAGIYPFQCLPRHIQTSSQIICWSQSDQSLPLWESLRFSSLSNFFLCNKLLLIKHFLLLFLSHFLLHMCFQILVSFILNMTQQLNLREESFRHPKKSSFIHFSSQRAAGTHFNRVMLCLLSYGKEKELHPGEHHG